MSEISFELQIIFKINIHMLAQFLHVEIAYELQVFLSDSKGQETCYLNPISLDIACVGSLLCVSSRMLFTCSRSTSRIDGRHFVIFNFLKESNLCTNTFFSEISQSFISLSPLKIKFKSSQSKKEQVTHSRNMSNTHRETSLIYRPKYDL